MVELNMYDISSRATPNLDKDITLSTKDDSFNLHLTTDFEKQFPNFKWQDIGHNPISNDISFDVVLNDTKDYQVPEQETSKEKIKYDILKKSAYWYTNETNDAKEFFEDAKKYENLRQINNLQISLQNNINNLSYTIEHCSYPQVTEIYKKNLIELLSGKPHKPLSGSDLYKSKVSLWDRITTGKAWKQQQQKFSETDAKHFNEITSYLLANPFFSTMKDSMLQDLKKGNSLDGAIKKLQAMNKEHASQSIALEKNLESKYTTNNFANYKCDMAQYYARELINEAVNANTIKQAHMQVDERIAAQEAQKAAEIAAEKAAKKAVIDTNKQKIIEKRANNNPNESSGILEADDIAQVKIDQLKKSLASRLANPEEKNKKEVLENIDKQGFEKKEITNIIKQQKQSQK